MVGFWRKNAWMETRLPAPSLIVLVGPSSAGKTTWATEHFAANVVAAPDRKALRDRIEQLRGRSTVEDYSRRNNAGTPDDHLELFTAYSEAGASHSIVSLPDVHLGGSIEAFAEVITAFEAS